MLEIFNDVLNIAYLTLKNFNTEKNAILSKSESVKFSLIESVICLFTDSSVNKYFHCQISQFSLK